MSNTTPRTQFLSSQENGVSEIGKGRQVAAIGHAARSADISDMLTARELEQLLRIDVKTIYAYVQKGLIPYVRIQSNIRFIRDEILDWITQQSFHPRGPNGNTRK